MSVQDRCEGMTVDEQDQLADWLVCWEEASAEQQSSLLLDWKQKDPDLTRQFLQLLRQLQPVEAALGGKGDSLDARQRLAGRYRLGEDVAAGGLGVLYSARDEEL